MLYSQKRLLASFVAIFLVAAAASAEPYVTAKMMDIATLMAPPPIAGSPADSADLKAVLAAQAQASAARKAQALADSDETIFVMFTSVLGDRFKTVALPKASALFARVSESEDDTLDAAKPIFGRVRPWIAHPDAKAYAKPSKSGSYPSGHTTQVAIDAIVLSAMVPEKRREIWVRAEDYAQSRVIGGMHYPTDLEGGWRAGTAMAAVMFQLPNFRADFEAARTEVRAALGLVALPAK